MTRPRPSGEEVLQDIQVMLKSDASPSSIRSLKVGLLRGWVEGGSGSAPLLLPQADLPGCLHQPCNRIELIGQVFTELLLWAEHYVGSWRNGELKHTLPSSPSLLLPGETEELVHSTHDNFR